jgi:hypothetical protein
MNSPFVPKIEKPCPANWDEMIGDEKQRFCKNCQLHVHNLSAMSLNEQQGVLSSRERVCISYIADPRAKSINSRIWVHLHSSNIFRRTAALFAAMASLFLSACRTTGKIAPQTPNPPVQESKVSDPPATNDGKRMGGAMPVYRPWWKRVLFKD